MARFVTLLLVGWLSKILRTERLSRSLGIFMSEATPEKFFCETLPSLFKPKEVKDWNRVIQVILKDDGEWILEIKDQKLTVQEGEHRKPDLEVESDFDTFSGLYKGEVFAPDAVRAGKMKTIGSMSDFMKFSKVFETIK